MASAVAAASHDDHQDLGSPQLSTMGDDQNFLRGTSIGSSLRKSLRRSSLMSRQLSAPAVPYLFPGTGQMRKKEVGYRPFGQEQEEGSMGSINKEENTVFIGQSEGVNVPSAAFEGNLASSSGDGFLQALGGVEDTSNKDELDGTGLCGKSRKNHPILHGLIQRVQNTVQIAAEYARRKISVKKRSKNGDLDIPTASGSGEDSS